jgi:hypothetical protein
MLSNDAPLRARDDYVERGNFGLEAVLRFVGSYPMWARLLVLACLSAAVATLILAPRTATTQPQKPAATAPESASKGQQAFLRVKPIKLFPDRPTAEVQLFIYVNGTEYRHPSVAGVEWMRVGPAMSEKIIELPPAPRYDVRFEMRIREGPTLKTQQQTSQQVTPIKALPYSEEYKLYQVENKSRAAAVSAVVSYEVYTQ